MAVQLLLTLFVFGGILPGLLIWLFVWLAVKGDVEKMKHELAQHLATGGASAQQQQQQWGGQGGQGGQGGYGAPPQLQQGQPQYDMQQGAPQLPQGMQQHQMPQLPQGMAQGQMPQLQQGQMPPQGMQQGSIAPGSPVMVQTPDGQQHPATFVQEAQGQCQVRFQNGHEQWYPSSSVRPA